MVNTKRLTPLRTKRMGQKEINNKTLSILVKNNGRNALIFTPLQVSMLTG